MSLYDPVCLTVDTKEGWVKLLNKIDMKWVDTKAGPVCEKIHWFGEYDATYRIIQANADEVFLLSDYGFAMDSLNREMWFETPKKSFFSLHLSTGTFTNRKRMLHKRQNYGLCLVGHQLYVIGGRDFPNTLVKKSEQYNALTD